MKTLSLRRNFAWNFVGTAGYRFSQWVLIVILTHLSHPELVGKFALMLAVSAPIFLTAGMKLRIAQATDVHERYSLGDYLSVRTATNIVSIIFALVVGLAFGLDGADLGAFFVLCLARAVEATSQSYYGFFQRYERLDLVSHSLIARSAMGPILFFLGLLSTDTLMGATAGLFAGWSIVQILLDRPRAQVLHELVHGQPSTSWPQIRIHTIRSMVKSYAALGLDAGFSSFSINIPRYVIQIVLGASQLAVFTTLAYLGQIISMIMSTMAGVIVPRLAMHYHAGKRQEFLRLMTILVCFGLIVSAVGVVASLTVAPPILLLILDPQYVNPELLSVLVLGAGATTLQRSLCKGIEASRNFSIYVKVDGVTTLGIAVAAIPLTQSWGVMGAAWSLVIGFTIGSVYVSYLLVGIVRSMPRN